MLRTQSKPANPSFIHWRQAFCVRQGQVQHSWKYNLHSKEGLQGETKEHPVLDCRVRLIAEKYRGIFILLCCIFFEREDFSLKIFTTIILIEIKAQKQKRNVYFILKKPHCYQVLRKFHFIIWQFIKGLIFCPPFLPSFLLLPLNSAEILLFWQGTTYVYF